MTKEEIEQLSKTLGPQFNDAIKSELGKYETTVKRLAEEAVKSGGYFTAEAFKEHEKATKALLDTLEAAATKQGTTIAELENSLKAGQAATKGIAQVLMEDEEQLQKLFENRNGTKAYMIHTNASGKMVMAPLDESKSGIKTVGPNATITGVNGGTAASIAQNIDAVSLLRIGAGSTINSVYRNSAWVFDLANTISASFISGQPYAMWFDEQPKDGASTTVAEGVAKPLVQYKYQLNTATYKKEAALVGFTQEFQMDFAQLESDIMNKARIDVINRVNAAILPNIIAAATAYNTGASFKGATPVATPNEYDVIAAMAAQVDNATFGANANAAVMGTFKKYRMGLIKTTQGAYLNRPEVINGISFVNNPAIDGTSLTADGILVGDFKQYNIMLRGGLIVRVGYNGTDFAQNMYSVVLEQFYYDYISTIRKVALVKGPMFADVIAAIGA